MTRIEDQHFDEETAKPWRIRKWRSEAWNDLTGWRVYRWLPDPLYGTPGYYISRRTYPSWQEAFDFVERTALREQNEKDWGE